MPPFTYKRKRTGGGYGLTQTYTPRVAKRARFVAPRRAPFIPGVDRTGGFYGRYSGRAGELKFHDVDLDDASVAANGTVLATSINLIPQGVTEITRVGRKCTIKSINWRGAWSKLVSTAEGDGGELVRLILYQDKQCNGATIAVTDLMESDDFRSFRNLSNSGRFNVLMDKVYTLNTHAAGGNGTAVELVAAKTQFQFYKKCNIPLEFSATTGAITEIRSNNISAIALSIKGDVVSMVSKIRLRFSDGS